MGVTEFEKDNLVIENVVTDNRLVLVSGQNLTRGTALKLDSGKLTECGATDIPHSVLGVDTDATSADTPCFYYVGGVLNEGSIGNFDDAMREKFRAVGIITKGAN